MAFSCLVRFWRSHRVFDQKMFGFSASLQRRANLIDNLFYIRPMIAIRLGDYTAATNSFGPVGTCYTFWSQRFFGGAFDTHFKVAR
jgi:hypothetical protein